MYPVVFLITLSRLQIDFFPQISLLRPLNRLRNFPVPPLSSNQTHQSHLQSRLLRLRKLLLKTRAMTKSRTWRIGSTTSWTEFCFYTVAEMQHVIAFSVETTQLKNILLERRVSPLTGQIWTFPVWGRDTKCTELLYAFALNPFSASDQWVNTSTMLELDLSGYCKVLVPRRKQRFRWSF